MKKFTRSLWAVLLAGTFCAVSPTAFGQGDQGKGFAPGKGLRQINFGLELEGYGLPVYAGMDFGVGEMITIGPRLVYQTSADTYSNNGNKFYTRNSVFVPSFRGDYHFSGHIEGLPNGLDFYGGLSLGVFTYRGTSKYTDRNGDVFMQETKKYEDAKLWIQLGGRYYFSSNWGVQLEFATLGNEGSGSIGFTYKF